MFVGIDGEGAGTDELGRQHYAFMAAAGGNFQNTLYTGKPLSSEDTLDFIVNLPLGPVYVGYFFDYDATMILRDLPDEQKNLLFQLKRGFVHWRDYAIAYRPKQYLMVGRPRKEFGAKWVRTINETGRFYQKSFVAACEEWGVGSEILGTIATMKEKRSSFSQITQEIKEYCIAECHLLSELITKLSEACSAADIVPKQWRGPGWIASRLFEQHNEITQMQLIKSRPQAVTDAAKKAYFGGRFEISSIGPQGKVWEYDINSAYPEAMSQLPCQVHGKWARLRDNEHPSTEAARWLRNVAFNHSASSLWCGFPIRSTKGYLYWPRQGNGWYWDSEIIAATSDETSIKGEIVWNGPGWQLIKNCDCEPYNWIEELYQYRKSIGKNGKGYVIKLGLNSLYGKKAQRQGSGRFVDYAAAGMITADTRAKLLQGCTDETIMLATDGVYATRELDLFLGGNLGDWERKEHNDFFIVQPGIYWDDENNFKSRGFHRRVLQDNKERFISAWNEFRPGVEIDITLFIGLRLAMSRNRPLSAGIWRNGSNGDSDAKKMILFEWRHKRREGTRVNGRQLTMPLLGDINVTSAPLEPQRDDMAEGNEE